MLEWAVSGCEPRPVAMRSTPEDAGGALSERDRQILDFERESWMLDVPKERAVRERFGFSAARYQQLLNRLIDRPEALEHDPMLVRRLRRLREARRRKRVAARLGVHS